MNWLLAVLLFLGLCVVAFLILIADKYSVKKKLQIVLLLFSPVLFFVLDYQFRYYQHQQDCEAEGGLKIWIEPEQSDQILIKDENSTGYKAAESYLKGFYPELRAVYVINDWGKDKGKYFLTQVISTTDDKYKRG